MAYALHTSRVNSSGVLVRSTGLQGSAEGIMVIGRFQLRGALMFHSCLLGDKDGRAFFVPQQNGTNGGDVLGKV